VLSPEEQALIARSLTSADHDYFVWSGMLGEPFLCGRTLCYYDGETAAVVGQPLAERGSAAAAGSENVREVIHQWARRSDVAFLNYNGPERLGPLPREEWNLLYASPPLAWNHEVFLNLNAPEQGRYCWEIRGQLRAAARRGLTVSIEHREFLGHEHIRLLRTLAVGHRFIASGASYLANVTSILRSPATVVCEGRVEGVLVGFTVTHEFFEHRPFLIVAAFNHAHRGTSDTIHAALIEYYRGRGADELGMGYAVDEGLYRYKTKWPAARVQPSCHQLIWQRVGAGGRYNDCLHWPWRLITDAVQAELSIPDERWLPRYQPIASEAIRVPVPDIAHLMDSSSGLSALMVVCRYYGVGPEDEQQYLRDLSLDTPWSDPERLVDAARGYGLCVDVRCPMSDSDLRGFLDARKPVVVLVQAWGEEDDETPRPGYQDVWEDDHWLVAIGYDRDGVIFEDPSLQGLRGYLSYTQLDERWHSWGRNQEPIRRFGSAMWTALGEGPAYLTRARCIM
jgi:predicted double-glycine peptidase